MTKISLYLTYILISFFLLCCSIQAEEIEEQMSEPQPAGMYILQAPLIEQVTKDTFQATGGVVLKRDDLTITADEVRGNLITGQWNATGGVELTRLDAYLRAEGVSYNLVERFGQLWEARGQYGSFNMRGGEAELAADDTLYIRNALGTTCDLEHPHWSLTADSLEIREGEYAVARRIGFWIGQTRIMTLPRYRFGLREERSFFPTPGYDKRDGAYLRYRYPLSVPGATAASVEGRLTQRNAFLAVLDLERELGSDVRDRRPSFGSPDVSADLMSEELLSMEHRTTKPRLPDRHHLDEELPPVSSRSTQVYFRAAHKQRIYDPEARYVHLDRRPEIGIRTLGIPLGYITTDSEPFKLDMQAGVGRFRERGDPIWRNRFDVRALVRLEHSIGTRWLFDPAVLLRYSSYSTGESQRIIAGSFAMGTRLTPQYFVAGTYIRHFIHNVSPFQFDDVDVTEKFATRIEGDWGTTRGSLTIDFDLQRGGVYDWGIGLSRSFHCFEPRIAYQNRFKSINFDITVIAVN